MPGVNVGADGQPADLEKLKQLPITPEGGNVNLACTMEPGHVTVRVRDTGMGIPLDEQPRIWERLYRGDKSRSQRGLGLGLSLVKAVVEAHGGKATVSSQVDQGSEFTISLPKQRQPE